MKIFLFIFAWKTKTECEYCKVTTPLKVFSGRGCWDDSRQPGIGHFPVLLRQHIGHFEILKTLLWCLNATSMEKLPLKWKQGDCVVFLFHMQRD